MEFSRPEYWSELPFPSPGNLPNPEMEPRSPAWQADALPSEPAGKSVTNITSLLLVFACECVCLAALGLRCCTWDPSSAVFVVARGLFSCGM